MWTNIDIQHSWTKTKLWNIHGTFFRYPLWPPEMLENILPAFCCNWVRVNIVRLKILLLQPVDMVKILSYINIRWFTVFDLPYVHQQYHWTRTPAITTGKSDADYLHIFPAFFLQSSQKVSKTLETYDPIHKKRALYRNSIGFPDQHVIPSYLWKIIDRFSRLP